MFCMIYHSHLVMEPSQPVNSYYSTPAVSAGPHVVFEKIKDNTRPSLDAKQLSGLSLEEHSLAGPASAQRDWNGDW